MVHGANGPHNWRTVVGLPGKATPSSVDLREDSGRKLSVTDSRIKLVFGTAQSDPSFPRDDFSPSRKAIISPGPTVGPACLPPHRPVVPCSEGRVVFSIHRRQPLPYSATRYRVPVPRASPATLSSLFLPSPVRRRRWSLAR